MIINETTSTYPNVCYRVWSFSNSSELIEMRTRQRAFKFCCTTPETGSRNKFRSLMPDVTYHRYNANEWKGKRLSSR